MSLGISSKQLARMRAQVSDLLPDTCVLHEPGAAVVDGSGSWTIAYSPVANGTVSCRLDPHKFSNRDNIEYVAAQEHTGMFYQVTLPYDAPFGANYRVVTGGNTYDVVVVTDVHSWNVSKRAVIVRLV